MVERIIIAYLTDNMTLFYGKSKELKFVPDNQKAWLDYLEINEGKRLVVKIDLEKGIRSHNQNSYYWCVLEYFANHTGHTSQELHSLFKRIFLPPKFQTILGREIKLPATTTTLNKSEFAEYMLKINAEAGQLGIILPQPERGNEKNIEQPLESSEEMLSKQQF